MRKLALVTALCLMVPCAIIPLIAHHSFAATYFVDKTVTAEGEVVQFLFRNPHTFIHVAVKDPKNPSAPPIRWAAEWAAGTALNSQGVSRDVLKAGDHVVLTGNPGRNPDEHRMRLNSVVRPKDGWKWSGTFQ